MPNHVTHHCVITGPVVDVERFVKTHIVTSEKGTGKTLDFETIIPMPEALRVESSSVVDQGVSIIAWLMRGQTAPVLRGRNSPALVGLLGDESLGRMLHWTWVKNAGIKTEEALAVYLLDRHPDCLTRAAKAIENVIRYGFKDWYEWSIAHWGTKWNCYDFTLVSEEPGRVAVQFDTAWSHPEPIFRKLTELHPTLSFNGEWQDEGGPTGKFYYGKRQAHDEQEAVAERG